MYGTKKYTCSGESVPLDSFLEEYKSHRVPSYSNQNRTFQEWIFHLSFLMTDLFLILFSIFFYKF